MTAFQGPQAHFVGETLPNQIWILCNAASKLPGPQTPHFFLLLYTSPLHPYTLCAQTLSEIFLYWSKCHSRLINSEYLGWGQNRDDLKLPFSPRAVNEQPMSQITGLSLVLTMSINLFFVLCFSHSFMGSNSVPSRQNSCSPGTSEHDLIFAD